MCKILGMGDLDRRKHDVDVIERVLGSVRETVGRPGEYTRLISVEVQWEGGGPARSTVELTVGLASNAAESPPPRRDRRRGDE